MIVASDRLLVVVGMIDLTEMTGIGTAPITTIAALSMVSVTKDAARVAGVAHHCIVAVIPEARTLTVDPPRTLLQVVKSSPISPRKF